MQAIEMPAQTSVQRAHDALLEAMPEGASHDSATCPLCQSGIHREAEKEVAHVSEETPKNVYTEDQHFALLTAAVERETAELSTAKGELEAQVASLTESQTELQTRVDALEAEKASLTAARDEAVKEFEDFKADLAEKAEVEARKADRIAAIKAANSDLDDEYFTDERVNRWAEMADEQFAVVLEAIETSAAAAKKKNKSDGDAEDKVDGGADEMKEKARETAAFKGGDAPSAGGGFNVTQFLQSTGKMPASKS